MAKKFMHFEDNDDGTTTVTVNIDPEHMDDMTVVLQTGLEEMVSLKYFISDPDGLIRTCFGTWNR